MTIINWLKGKKTYILGLVAIIYALSGLYLGKIDPQTAMSMIWVGLTPMAIRAGISKNLAIQVTNQVENQPIQTDNQPNNQ